MRYNECSDAAGVSAPTAPAHTRSKLAWTLHRTAPVPPRWRRSTRPSAAGAGRASSSPPAASWRSAWRISRRLPRRREHRVPRLRAGAGPGRPVRRPLHRLPPARDGRGQRRLRARAAPSCCRRSPPGVRRRGRGDLPGPGRPGAASPPRPPVLRARRVRRAGRSGGALMTHTNGGASPLRGPSTSSPLFDQTVSGRVTAVNEKGVRLDSSDGWLNYSKFAVGLVAPSRGDAVTLTLDKAGFVRSVEFGADASAPTNGAQPARNDAQGGSGPSGDRDRTITRLAVLKAAAEFGAARPDLRSRDVIAIAAVWERWVLSPDIALPAEPEPELDEAF